MLNTHDFACWDAAVASTLGHHRSGLLNPGDPFAARFRVGQLGGFGVLHLKGSGRLRLIREQCRQSVLWMPLQGLNQERINGVDWLAEPGTALLFQPGDAMEGETGEAIEGVSILLPEASPLPHPNPGAPLLAAGPMPQRVLACARQLALAAARRPAGAEHAADQLMEALRQWMAWEGQPSPRERITARRRRETVEEACRWMDARLEQRFGVEELSAALAVSTRQLQYSFQQELGRTPMGQAKLLRLRRLRALLQDRDQDRRTIAELMAAAGLIASGVTSADYRGWCGESPSRTRRWR